MVNINEAAPVEIMFDGIEKVDKKELIGKEIIINAFAKMSSDDGEYAIVLLTVEGEKASTTFSSILVERLDRALEKIGENTTLGNSKEVYFKEGIEATLVEKESTKNKGRKYFDLE